jgi:hypothetical protein
MRVGRDENTILLERIAKGIEKLAEDPIVEMEVGPPVCPHCDRLNPRIATHEQGGTGQLYEMFVAMRCEECGGDFYGVPVQWEMHTDTETLRHALQERAGYVDNGRRR